LVGVAGVALMQRSAIKVKCFDLLIVLALAKENLDYAALHKGYTFCLKISK